MPPELIRSVSKLRETRQGIARKKVGRLLRMETPERGTMSGAVDYWDPKRSFGADEGLLS